MPNILIVDDDAVNRDILRLRLKKAGFETVQAADGPAGLAAARAHRPDLVLLDGMMPGMDGWEVCAKLKSEPETRGIPVVMLSACADGDPRVTGCGADACLTKPCVPAELLRILGSFMPLSGS